VQGSVRKVYAQEVLLALGASMREGWENGHVSVLSRKMGGVFVMSGVGLFHYCYFMDIY
jgi:hypothetical protein